MSCGDHDEGLAEFLMRGAFIMELPTKTCHLVCCGDRRREYGFDDRFEGLGDNREYDLVDGMSAFLPVRAHQKWA